MMIAALALLCLLKFVFKDSIPKVNKFNFDFSQLSAAQNLMSVPSDALTRCVNQGRLNVVLCIQLTECVYSTLDPAHTAESILRVPLFSCIRLHISSHGSLQ